MLAMLLLLLSPSVMAQDEYPEAFWEALYANDVSAVAAQLDAGISADTATAAETALCYAIKYDSIEMVTTLLAHGANPNLAEPVTAYSPLMIAAKHGKSDVVELLLAQHADVNQTSVFGRTPLNMAALHDSLAVGHLLLTKTDVDVNARGKLCALAVASRQGYLDFVKMIFAEAKVAPTAKCLASAKNMASLNQHAEVLNVLQAGTINSHQPSNP